MVNDKTYSIVPIDKFDSFDINNILEPSKNLIRKSTDGLFFIVKYYTKPSFIDDSCVEYIYDEINVVIEGDNWNYLLSETEFIEI